MGLKGLREFCGFDFDRFIQGKQFTVTGISPWKDYSTGDVVGSKVETAITVDKTHYKPGKNGNPISNLYEKLVFKIGKNVNLPIGAVVIPVGAVASVYGDFSNQLSVRVTDIKVVQTSASPASGPATGGKGLG